MALLFWISPFGFAQNVSAKVVQGGVLIDGTGGAVLENSVIVIQNGKISAVMTAADPNLGSLLNICEGKAHLSWSGTSDVLDELERFCEDGSSELPHDS